MSAINPLTFKGPRSAKSQKQLAAETAPPCPAPESHIASEQNSELPEREESIEQQLAT